MGSEEVLLVVSPRQPLPLRGPSRPYDILLCRHRVIHHGSLRRLFYLPLENIVVDDQICI